jgi:hypothetical protein
MMRIPKVGVALLTVWSSVAFAQGTSQPSQAEPLAVSDSAVDKEFRIAVSSGMIYSSGDYGGPETTNIVVVPFSLRVSSGGLRVSATLPYLRIESPGNVVGGGDGPPIIIGSNAPSARGVREGFGDLSLGAAFTLPSKLFDALDVDLSGRIKLPTSSSTKSLGTGKTDFALATEFSYSIETWAPYLRLGYRFFGDLPSINIRNGPSASVGTTKQIGRIVAIVSYDYSRATTPAVEDAHEVFAALSGPLSGALNWTGYGIVGLSAGSPNFGLGLLLSAQLN